MCSETFLRLPEEKRNRFLDAAWEEFSRVPFTEASINKIVVRARIPRGSFYQYFTDKEELFLYLLGGMLNHFYAEYNKILAGFQGDIFQTQLRCFDQVVQKKDLDPLFDRGLVILQQNPEFLVQIVVENQMGYGIWEAVQEHINLSAFRDVETAKQTFMLSLMALAVAMRSGMMKPEQLDLCRRELAMRLEILKNGSLAVQPAKEAL